MDREIKLHPSSALFGLAIGVLALVCMSQIMAPTIPTHRVECGPHPRDFVQIKEGAPFTVPTGRIFVLTALGGVGGAIVNLNVNGNQEVRAAAWPAGLAYAGANISEIPRGFSVPGPATVEAITQLYPGSGAQAWGYLADK